MWLLFHAFFYGTRLSKFSYTTSCTCICLLVWLTYRFKVINSLMRDAWVSSYKQTGRFWPIFRTTRPQQRDHSFRYSLCFPSFAIMALCRNVLQEDDVLWELYGDTCSDVSDYSEWQWQWQWRPSLVHINNCDLLLHWPHNFHTHFSSHLSRQFL